MRVAVVASLHAINSVYRALPLIELRARGHEVHVDPDGQALVAGALRGADVVHVYRERRPRLRRALRAMRSAGVAVVWDNDDWVAPPQAKHGEAQARQAHAETLQMLRLAHLVTTTTPMLAEQYRAWGAPEVQVVENYLPDRFAAAPPPRGDGVVVGWTAGGEHRYDLEQLGLRATLERLLAARPEVRVASVGVALRIPSERYTHTRVVEYRDLAGHVAAFDVGLAPIADVPFNRARSSVKVKEYAAMGVPWLASPIGPYAGLGEKEGGRLVPDDRWYEELDRLVGDARARRKLAKRGVKWADGHRLRRHMDTWEGALEQAVANARFAALAP